MLAGTKIWNSCVWKSREARREGRRYPTEKELKAKFKRFKSWKELHSQSAQAVVEEYFEGVGSCARLRKNGHPEANPPGFKPKNRLRTITWKKGGFEYKNGRLLLKLSKGREAIPVSLPEGADTLALPDGTVLKGTPVEVKVKAIYRGSEVAGLELHVTWDFGVVPLSQGEKVSACDVNSTFVGGTTTAGDQQLIVCRELLSLVQYRNKVIAEFQQKMSRCREGSRRWKGILKAKRSVLRRLDRRIKQMTHALTKLMAELDFAKGVAVSVIGDLTGVRRRARTGDKSKKANQKINQLPYAQIEQQHAYKSLSRQVLPKPGSERYSSQTCYCCGGRNRSYRVHRGLWRCKKCSRTLHADLNGSGNILKNYLFDRCDIKGPWPLKPPDVYRWDRRHNRFAKVSPRAAA